MADTINWSLRSGKKEEIAKKLVSVEGHQIVGKRLVAVADLTLIIDDTRRRSHELMESKALPGKQCYFCIYP